MNKTLLILLTASLVTFTACQQKADSNANKDDKTVEQETKTSNAMTTIQMTKVDFLTKVHNYEQNMETWKYLGDKPAIIDFYADWCGPCKQIAPILEELATEYGDDIYIYKVDVDSEEELAALFNIRSIPSMLFIPMEGQPQMAAGAASKAEMKRKIDSILLQKQ